MKHVTTILFIVMLSMASCATNRDKGTAKKSGPPTHQPEPLNDQWSHWIVGEWEVTSGESSLADESGKVDTFDVNELGASVFKIEFGLNGQFLIKKSRADTAEMNPDQIKYFKDTLKYSDEEIERLKRYPYQALIIQTLDPKTGEVIAYLFDSLRCTAAGRGTRQGHKEVIDWVWAATAQGATSVSTTEKINDDKFTYNHKYILPNGNKMEDKIEFTRKKTTTEKQI